jgi:hypothetical protein
MRLASLALIGLAVAAIGLALLTVGGPGQARAERRDQARMNDLHSLARQVICLRRQGLAPDGHSDTCPEAAHRRDPLTDAPYRVDAVSDEAVRVCAVFETRMTGQWWADRDDFDPETGCLIVRMQDAGRW